MINWARLLNWSLRWRIKKNKTGVTIKTFQIYDDMSEKCKYNTVFIGNVIMS